MVSKAIEDLPEPESPVNTISLSRGNVRSTLRRLCSLAPRITISSFIRRRQYTNRTHVRPQPRLSTRLSDDFTRVRRVERLGVMVCGAVSGFARVGTPVWAIPADQNEMGVSRAGGSWRFARATGSQGPPTPHTSGRPQVQTRSTKLWGGTARGPRSGYTQRQSTDHEAPD